MPSKLPETVVVRLLWRRTFGRRGWNHFSICLCSVCLTSFRLSQHLISYLKIFGNRATGNQGQPALATQVLCQYCDASPDGKEKKGAKRGTLSLTTFSHEHSVKKARTRRRGKAIWDFEIFINQMKLLRGWMPERCEKEWAALLQIPENLVDKTGPHAARPERLRIPPWMAGNEAENNDDEVAETKRLSSHSKSSGSMTDEMKAQLKSELFSGFSRLLDSPKSGDLLQPLASGALTSGSSADSSGMSLLLKAASDGISLPIFFDITSGSRLL